MLQVIYRYLQQHGEWPTFGQIDRPLRRQHGLDAAAPIRDVPKTILLRIGVGISAVRPDDKLCLTLLGVSMCTGGEEDVERFLVALRYAAKIEIDFEPSDEDSNQSPRVTASDFADLFGLQPDSGALNRLYAMLYVDNPGTGSSDGNAGAWYFELKREFSGSLT